MSRYVALLAFVVFFLVGCRPANDPFSTPPTRIADESFSIVVPMSGSIRDRDFTGETGNGPVHTHIWVLTPPAGVDGAFIVGAYDAPPGKTYDPKPGPAQALGRSLLQHADAALDAETITTRSGFPSFEYRFHTEREGKMVYGRIAIVFSPHRAFVLVFAAESPALVGDARIDRAFSSITVTQ